MVKPYNNTRAIENATKLHTDAKTLIFECLNEYEETRNNDTLLCFKVWEKQGLDLEKLEEQIEKSIIYNPETIIRHRAFIQNVEYKYLPTRISVLIKRKIKEAAIRKYYATTPDIITSWEQVRYCIK